MVDLHISRCSCEKTRKNTRKGAPSSAAAAAASSWLWGTSTKNETTKEKEDSNAAERNAPIEKQKNKKPRTITQGDLLSLRTPCWVERAVARGEGQTWETEWDNKKHRGTVRRGRELHGSRCSLNEVFLLLLGMRVVALSVDNGRVSVGRVVRSFGFVRQVCSFGEEEKTNPSEGKQIVNSPAWCRQPQAQNPSEDNISDATLFINRTMRRWESVRNVKTAEEMGKTLPLQMKPGSRINKHLDSRQMTEWFADAHRGKADQILN